MKVKEVALSGVMCACFVVVCMLTQGTGKSIQTYSIIVKTIIIAVMIKKNDGKNCGLCMAVAVTLCLILTSITDTLIYNLPAIVGGITIGTRKGKNKVIDYVVYMLVTILTNLYRYITFYFFMNVSLISIYKEQFFATLTTISSGYFTSQHLTLGFIVFMLIDLIFSTLVIFTAAHTTFDRVLR